MSDPRRSTQEPAPAEADRTDAPVSAVSPADGSPSAASPADRSRRPVRALLWLLIVVGVGANTATSLGPFHPAISLVFGLATVLCIGLLIAHHVRGRR